MSIANPSETFRELLEWPGYRVSNWGRVQSNRGRYSLWEHRNEWIDLKITKSRQYLQVRLYRSDGKPFARRVHRLVLEAFVGRRPRGMQCRHLDGNPQNNRLDNICWGTPRQNYDDSIHHEKFRGEKNPRAILNEPMVRLFRRLILEAMTVKEISEEFNVGLNTVRLAAKGVTWKHVTI